MKIVRNCCGLALLALLAASCAPSPFLRPPVGAGWTSAAKHLEMEYQIHEGINRERVAHGLPPLVFDSVLADLARDHSRAMATGNRSFGHDHFRDRARTARTVVPASRVVGENVASNLQDRALAGRHVVRQWLNSRDHRETIHDASFAVTGVGVSQAANGEFYFMQIFVTRGTVTTARR